VCLVLAIDDERAILDMLKRALILFGFRVEIASTGEEGIEKFAKTNFDIVITDVLMPGVDGVGVLKYIRNSNRGDTPVIGISGTPWLLQNEDFDLVLDKPFSIKTLAASVRQFAEKRRALSMAQSK
jgi:CheY-like chemotaxis protein